MLDKVNLVSEVVRWAAEPLLRKRDLDERRNWGRMRGEGTCVPGKTKNKHQTVYFKNKHVHKLAVFFRFKNI